MLRGSCMRVWWALLLSVPTTLSPRVLALTAAPDGAGTGEGNVARKGSEKSTGGDIPSLSENILPDFQFGKRLNISNFSLLLPLYFQGKGGRAQPVFDIYSKLSFGLPQSESGASRLILWIDAVATRRRALMVATAVADACCVPELYTHPNPMSECY